MEATAETTDVSLLLDRVRRHIYHSSVRILDFFKAFDFHNHGVISVSQFHRGLDAAGVRFSEDQAMALADAYRGKECETVNYLEFCEDANLVFKMTGLEKNPNLEPPKPGEVLLPPPEVRLGAEEAAAAEDALRRLRLLTATRHLDFRAAYAQYDKHNTGKLTPSVFLRAFPIAFRENKFTEAEVRLLGRLVTTPEGLVDCRKLRQLIESPEEKSNRSVTCESNKEPRGTIAHLSAEVADETHTFQSETPTCKNGSAQSRGSRASKAALRSWTRETLSPLEKIKTAVAVNQLSIKETFRGFDSLRKGVCTKDQALAVLLSTLRIQLGENDIETLFRDYVDSDGMFKYESLCSEIAHALGNPDAQQFPTRVVPVPTASDLRKAQEDRTPLTSDEKARLEKLLARLAFQVQQTRKIITPTFQDFDKRRTQHVTRLQLWRILGMLDLTVNEEELNLLCLWLCDKGNLLEVAYRPLIEALDLRPIQKEETEPTADEACGSIYFVNGKVVPYAESSKFSSSSSPKTPATNTTLWHCSLG